MKTNHILNFILLLPLLMITHISKGQSEYPTQQIDQLIQDKIKHEGHNPVHSFLLYLENESTGFVYHKGLGLADGKNITASVNSQFNIASITKTFVSVIILQLMEESRLALSDKASKYLGKIDFLDFSNIHVLNDTSYANEITIEHLLKHESGLGDFFIDTETRFNISVYFHRKRQYDPEKIIKRFYKYNLNKKPHFKPGEGYYYSDINYVLLGLIIQEITGKSLSQAIRSRILEPLNMKDTYFEFYETPRESGSRAHAYIDKFEITGKINTSYEWGGGGLVSTTGDLATFIQSLFENKLFRKKATLEMLISSAAESPHNYGMGLTRFDVDGTSYYGHGGFYGSLMIYNPEKKITLVACVNQANVSFDAQAFVKKVISISNNANQPIEN